MKPSPCPRMRFAFLLILLATGCRSASTPVSYYALSATDLRPNAAGTSSAARAIGIGQITMPDYLDRAQMVVRTGPHQLRIDDYHVWAAPLSEEVARILTENLMTLTGSPSVEHMPWGMRFKPDVIIGIRIFNFEASVDGQVRLAAAVRVTDRRNAGEQSFTVDMADAAGGRQYPELVAAQSRVLAAFSRRIAAALPQ